jgi:hypothetical protein
LRGVELVDTSASGQRRQTVTTLRAAGEFFGVTPAAPPLWRPTTTPDLDAPLAIAMESVMALGAWFRLVSTCLAGIDSNAAQTLWPEHFDLAITADGATYGGSPGDGEHAQPYLYVIPPSGSTPVGDRAFWNESFGASLARDRIDGLDDAVAFFTDAAARIGTSTGAPS